MGVNLFQAETSCKVAKLQSCKNKKGRPRIFLFVRNDR